jgi:predicted DNA-binding transcriptional regulator AlpA
MSGANLERRLSMSIVTKEFQPDRLLTVNGAAEFLQLSESWLNKARLTGCGPRFIKMGRSVRYGVQALEEFKRANARGSTSEYDSHSGPGPRKTGSRRARFGRAPFPLAH